jgi:cytochrome oxidase Cu insertion factor (SCO1/SenC/PrrC family)
MQSDPEKPGATGPTGGVSASEPGDGLTRREFFSTLAWALAVAGVAAVIGVLSAGREKKAGAASPPDRERQLVDFDLVERSGRPVSRADLAGKFLVVDFVFTSCSLSCRGVNEQMEEIQRLSARLPDVLLVSLTVDPRTDTPAALARFAELYHADPKRWLFLTGDKTELYRLIETSFIPKSPELEDIFPGGFSNTDRIALVAPDGRVFATFDGLKRSCAAEVIAEIEKHRNDPPK